MGKPQQAGRAAGDKPGRWPPEAVVQRIHDRYLTEVVEGLNLCPFARRSRELGRVHRPLFWVDEWSGASALAGAASTGLADLVAAHADAEIVLLTFIVPTEHAWTEPHAFDDFLRELREAYEALDSERFYMVAFHPEVRRLSERKLNADTLVARIRRSPDPVVQCVRGEVLDAVRAQAKTRISERMEAELESFDPEVRAMIRMSDAWGPDLSADIAQNNFESFGRGAGLERLDEILDDICQDRERSYTPARG